MEMQILLSDLEFSLLYTFDCDVGGLGERDMS